MAKRRAEETPFPDSPSKRCHRSLCGVDGMAANGGVSPPSLLAVLGSRCRKRPHCFEEPEQQQQQQHDAALYRKTAQCHTSRKHAAAVLAAQPSGNFQEVRSSIPLSSSKKRHREDSVGAEAAHAKGSDTADADSTSEDCTYNSFQYWRVPLPELDLSLLEDVNRHSQPKQKSKVKSSPAATAMET